MLVVPRSMAQLAAFWVWIDVDLFVFNLKPGARRLRGLQQLSRFVFYYKNNGGVRGVAGVGWAKNVRWCSTHTSCYRTVRSLALPHVCNATLV